MGDEPEDQQEIIPVDTEEIKEAEEQIVQSTSKASSDQKICDKCGSEGNFQQVRLIRKGLPRGTKPTQYTWGYNCSNKECGGNFGGYYRFNREKVSYLECQIDGMPLDPGETPKVLVADSTIGVPLPILDEAGAEISLTGKREGHSTVASSSSSNDVNSLDGSPEDIDVTNCNPSSEIGQTPSPSKPTPTPARKGKRPKMQARKSTGRVFYTEKKEEKQEEKKEEKKVEKKPIPKVPKTPKKLPRGYVYEEIPIATNKEETGIKATMNHIATMMKQAPKVKYDEGTQTGCELHQKVKDLEKAQTDKLPLPEDADDDAELDLSPWVMRRLRYTKTIITQQKEQIDSLESRNEKLSGTMSQVSTVLTQLVNVNRTNLDNLRCDIDHMAKELMFFKRECLSEAQGTAEEFKKRKKKMEDSYACRVAEREKYKAQVEISNAELTKAKAFIEFLQSEMEDKDREVVMAKKEKNRTKKNLADTMFIKTNQKCMNCNVVEQNHKRMLDEITASLNEKRKLIQQMSEMSDRCAEAEGRNEYLEHEMQKLQFEHRAYKTDNERLLAENEQFRKGIVPKALHAAHGSTFTTSPENSNGHASEVGTPRQNGGGFKQKLHVPRTPRIEHEKVDKSPRFPSKTPRVEQEKVEKSPRFPPKKPRPEQNAKDQKPVDLKPAEQGKIQSAEGSRKRTASQDNDEARPAKAPFKQNKFEKPIPNGKPFNDNGKRPESFKPKAGPMDRQDPWDRSARDERMREERRWEGPRHERPQQQREIRCNIFEDRRESSFRPPPGDHMQPWSQLPSQPRRQRCASPPVFPVMGGPRPMHGPDPRFNHPPKRQGPGGFSDGLPWHNRSPAWGGPPGGPPCGPPLGPPGHLPPHMAPYPDPNIRKNFWDAYQ